MSQERNFIGLRAGRLVRPALFFAGLLLATTALEPTAAAAQPVASQAVGGSLFFRPGNAAAANELVRLIQTAKVDGLDPRRYRSRELPRLVRAAFGGNPQAIARADRALSDALARYVQDLRRAPNVGIIYVDSELRPQAPSAASILAAASAAPNLGTWVRDMGWMHPYYAQLRRQLTDNRLDAPTAALVSKNLQRARSLPAGGRYVLVNVAAQRLFMVENNQTVDMMRVVVGKPVYPTPMMAALIRYTSLRPYWNVPSDLAAERIVPNVVKGGNAYLRQKGYQVLSDWSDRPKVVNPASVDWKAVAAGRKEVRLRQLPGPANSMGDMKFMFPNAQGIYLHDTPQDELFGEAARLFSGGCVRLEAAHRLATWLYGKPLRAKGATPEQKVSMAKPVPVYLTYLTAVPSGTELAYYEDIYRRDGAPAGTRRLARR
ncbi:L,D-transpeptidase family protein [Sphingomonas sp. LHG3406-1]|uniref:L,D-transpeptidase family protein n=1 Tax=Sphingomonas sp. LHG3406-1 TaxID=2804617 RepID=UPI0026332FB8|nr:L,D-transpeptidase family protein [Sphingomonas sp. LHG3406-1]